MKGLFIALLLTTTASLSAAAGKCSQVFARDQRKVLFDARQASKERYTRKGLNGFLFSKMANFSRGDRVLFIGAGGKIEMDLRQFMMSRGLSQKEVESSLVTVDIDPSMKPDIIADLNHSNVLPRQSADWVIMMEVLYAIGDPQNAMNEAYAALKPGGTIVFSNMYAMPVEGSYHAGNYTNHHLRRFAENAGFGNVEVIARNNWAEAIGGLVTRLLRDRDPELQQFALDYMKSDFARTAEALANKTQSDVPITSGWYASGTKE